MAGKGIVVDFTGVSTFNIIPMGRHHVSVKSAEIAKAKNTSNNVLTFTFEDEDGATIQHRITLLKTVLWKLKQTLEALGESDLDGKYKLVPESLVGRECEIEVVEEENDGKMRSKVENCYKSKAKDKAPMEEADEDDFDELL